MCRICITEHGIVIGIDGGRFRTLTQSEEYYVPKEIVDGVAIYGKSHMTAPAIQFCLEKGILVSYFTQTGKYYECS